MSLTKLNWEWLYTMQFTSGRAFPAPPTHKHAVPEGLDVSLCNRRPYWRLPEEYRRWMGVTPEEAELLPTLQPCRGCIGKIAEMEERYK